MNRRHSNGAKYRTLHVFCGDDFYLAFGDGSQEFLAVGLGCYSAVQDNHDARVGLAADQAAEALLELDYG